MYILLQLLLLLLYRYYHYTITVARATFSLLSPRPSTNETGAVTSEAGDKLKRTTRAWRGWSPQNKEGDLLMRDTVTTTHPTFASRFLSVPLGSATLHPLVIRCSFNPVVTRFLIEHETSSHEDHFLSWQYFSSSVYDTTGWILLSYRENDRRDWYADPIDRLFDRLTIIIKKEISVIK